MIIFKNFINESPYQRFKEKYGEAIKSNQPNIEASVISSYCELKNEVNSRFVNIKFLDGYKFIFFTNYDSPKAREFENHSQITSLFFWNKINTQIRVKALINKTSKKFNNLYFKNRSFEKNALAISSSQSSAIDSYEKVKDNYNKSLKIGNLTECPEYWGGYSISPYYFEFWEGHDLRLNKREAYKKEGNDWKHSYLQP
jgi:pyridoxamine-phosphate oxidase